MAATTPIAYAEDVRPEDTEQALATVTVALFPDESHPLAIDFRGTCPRCGDSIESRHWLVTVTSSLRISDQQLQAIAGQLDTLGVDRAQGDETIDLTCSCDKDHPRRPKAKRGCGARFRVRVTWP